MGGFRASRPRSPKGAQQVPGAIAIENMQLHEDAYYLGCPSGISNRDTGLHSPGKTRVDFAAPAAWSSAVLLAFLVWMDLPGTHFPRALLSFPLTSKRHALLRPAQECRSRRCSAWHLYSRHRAGIRCNIPCIFLVLVNLVEEKPDPSTGTRNSGRHSRFSVFSITRPTPRDINSSGRLTDLALKARLTCSNSRNTDLFRR